MERLVNLATRQDMNKIMSDFDSSILECYKIVAMKCLNDEEGTERLIASRKEKIEKSKIKGSTMSMTTEALDVIIATSDERVMNNVVRHEYRVLTDDEKADMKEIKDLGASFIKKINQIREDRVATASHSEFVSIREYFIAEERIEEAVMWAVKGLTK